MSFGNCGTEGFALSLSQIQEFSKTDPHTPPQPERASQVALVIKNMSANADIRDSGLIPGSGRPPREGNYNPLQHSCLENPMDRGTRWATVHGIAKSWTRLKQLITVWKDWSVLLLPGQAGTLGLPPTLDLLTVCLNKAPTSSGLAASSRPSFISAPLEESLIPARPV